MKKLIFVESFLPTYDYTQGEVVALSLDAAYLLENARIPHYTISDLVDFEAYLQYEEEYTALQLQLFQDYDSQFSSLEINKGVSFSPIRVYGYYLKFILDSLFSQALLLNTIIKRLMPGAIELLGSYRPRPKIEYDKMDVYSRSFKYLNYEVLEFLASVSSLPFSYKYVKPGLLGRTRSWRAEIRNEISSSHTFKVYRQRKRAFGKEPVSKELAFLEGARVMVNNMGWGLDKLFSSLMDVSDALFLLDGYTFFMYERGRLKKVKKLSQKGSSAEKVRGLPKEPLEGIGSAFCEVFRTALGVSCKGLLRRRKLYLEQAIMPHIYHDCLLADELLVTYGIEYALGNQKMYSLSFALAYLATYKDSCKYLFFTHGYDVYDADRTFLELPCNKYYTLSEEYSQYFQGKFAAQQFYMRPESVEVGPFKLA